MNRRLVSIKIDKRFYDELALKGVDPEMFIDHMLDQHFVPWEYVYYENMLISSIIREDCDLTVDEMQVIKKYITGEILKDFMDRMDKHYDRSYPDDALEYKVKELGYYTVKMGFNRKRVKEKYKGLIETIKRKDPKFSIDMFIDNMERIYFMPQKQRRVLDLIEKLDSYHSKEVADKRKKRVR
jgi:hypothetical protein